jgi:hypothetical protein
MSGALAVLSGLAAIAGAWIWLARVAERDRQQRLTQLRANIPPRPQQGSDHSNSGADAANLRGRRIAHWTVAARFVAADYAGSAMRGRSGPPVQLASERFLSAVRLACPGSQDGRRLAVT